MRLPEGTWFKPTERFVLDGERWLTNGQIALAVEDDGGSEKDRSVFLSEFAASCTKSVRGFRRVGGHAIADGGKIFAGHFVDLVEEIWPRATYRIQPVDLPGLAAYHENNLVAVLMCMRKNVRDIMRGVDVCEPPPCPRCGGNGHTDERHKCTCGHEHHGVCAACAGTGTWRAAS